jgi:hypothetical protein
MPEFRWRLYAEIFVAPLCRKRNGSHVPKFHITAIVDFPVSAHPQMETKKGDFLRL